MNKPAIIYNARAEFAQSYFYELCYCSTHHHLSSLRRGQPFLAAQMRRILDQAKSSLHPILLSTPRKLNFSATAKVRVGHLSM